MKKKSRNVVDMRHTTPLMELAIGLELLGKERRAVLYEYIRTREHLRQQESVALAS